MFPLLPALILLILSGQLSADVQALGGTRAESFAVSRALEAGAIAQLSQVLAQSETSNSGISNPGGPEVKETLSFPPTMVRVGRAYARNERSRDGPLVI